MNKSIIRLLTLILALCMALGMTACGEDEAPAKKADPTTTAPSESVGESTDPTTTTTTAPALPQNPLTGLKDFDTDNNRPVAFAVPDESADIVQVGIEHAEMYFEAETEAGIPRMLAIFSSIDTLPDRVGPIRSARPHFVKFVDALDAIYCHVGGSPDARKELSKRGIADIENASVEDATLAEAVKAGNNYSWNNKAFTRTKVLDAIKKASYRTTSKTTSPFTFGDKQGDKTANSIAVPISRSYTIGFTYNEKTGTYTKRRVTTRGADTALTMDAHKTGSGGTITVSNVIVMYDQRSVLDYKNGSEYRIDFALNSGSGLLVSGGTAREIKWKRTDEQLTYFEADGKTPLEVAEGKTFVCVTSKDLESRTVLK